MAHDYYYYYITILLEIYQKHKQYFPISRCTCTVLFGELAGLWSDLALPFLHHYLIFVMLIFKTFIQDQSSKFITLLMKRP